MSAEPATPLTDVSVPEESIHGFAANWVSTEAPKTIEEAILRHSWRGMLELSAFVSPTYCHDAAREILSWPRGTVLLATGFFVAGQPETDGPAGTMVLASALEKLGFTPVIVAEPFAREYFRIQGFRIAPTLPEKEEPFYAAMLKEHSPAGLVSIERCGRNDAGDYCNMRGESVAALTSSIDDLFLQAKGRIPTVGVGDGGNEIGMGNLASQIRESLELSPCVVEVDNLVLASVSNWGAYGIAACLEELSGTPLLPEWQEVYDFLVRTVELGSVDGVTREPVATVDGYALSVSQSVYQNLLRLVRH